MDNTTTIRNLFGLRIHIISTELQILSSNSIRPPVPLGRRYHAFTFDRLSDEEILKNFRFRREDLPRLKRCLELPFNSQQKFGFDFVSISYVDADNFLIRIGKVRVRIRRRKFVHEFRNSETNL
ncbi:unnamed protein product [Nesidiocoris tenuis]|uniref:Uncharacterized protein n=1 Tax=Nesidiocoris tenuis TaxID=355587 RepID=A0A6H5GWY4_9HEMI|nr:unnamed protein product [Nesidiocoris tenuis]